MKPSLQFAAPAEASRVELVDFLAGSAHFVNKWLKRRELGTTIVRIGKDQPRLGTTRHKREVARSTKANRHRMDVSRL